MRIDENGSLVLEMGAELSGVRRRERPTCPRLITRSLFKPNVRWGAISFVGSLFLSRIACHLDSRWLGGSLIGISSLDDFDASENETGDAYVFEDKKWYDVRLRVTEEKLQVGWMTKW